jgi:RimJ/RimL family protein N-acetyltransferase
MPKSGMHACTAEVGYWLGRDCWGQGIATEALTRATAWAWTALPPVQRLVAPIFARNVASQRVAAKAGYALEALQPRSVLKGGVAIDVALYVALRSGQSGGELAPGPA